jgi:uncharacterized protein YcgI (DUF1989 family)
MNKKRLMMKPRKLIHEEVIPPKQGFAAVVKKGRYFRIIDLKGKQVADVVFFNAENIREKNSNGISMSRQMRPGESYKLKDKLTTGDVIFSTAYRPMATIVADTPVPKGTHKLVLHMCNQGLYETFGFPDHVGCWEMECIVAFSNCPMDVIGQTNAGVCTPLKLEIYEEDFLES